MNKINMLKENIKIFSKCLEYKDARYASCRPNINVRKITFTYTSSTCPRSYSFFVIFLYRKVNNWKKTI